MMRPATTTLEPLREATTRLRVRYQIYPEVSLPGHGEPATWFELALHAELAEYQPPGHPSSRDARFVLNSLADFLVGRLQPKGSVSITRSETNTLRPEDAAGTPLVRVCRTLSLVFSDVGPFTAHHEPQTLTALLTELARLGVPRLQDTDQ